jgi:hypothetical protein
LTGGKKSRMEFRSDWPVEGLLVHVAGQGPPGFRVVDVWQSEEACNRFREILGPILNEVGADEPPEMYGVLLRLGFSLGSAEPRKVGTADISQSRSRYKKRC